jgi:hypothetical protein
MACLEPDLDPVCPRLSLAQVQLRQPGNTLETRDAPESFGFPREMVQLEYHDPCCLEQPFSF